MNLLSCSTRMCKTLHLFTQVVISQMNHKKHPQNALIFIRRDQNVIFNLNQK